MLVIPNFLSTPSNDLVDWTIEIAECNKSKAAAIKELITNAQVSNKHQLLSIDEPKLIQFLLLCLSYGHLDPATVHSPHYGPIIRNKIAETLSAIDLADTQINPVYSIEDQIIAMLAA